MEATQSTSQVVCTHCEELVHRYAARCPYCQHDLTSPIVALPELHFDHMPSPVKEMPQGHSVEQLERKNIEKQGSKITPIVPEGTQTATKTATTTFKQQVVIEQKPFAFLAEEQAAKSTKKENEAGENIYKVLFSLIALLTGSFFAFFGFILKLFSKNGKLVIEWNAESWPYYLFPALLLLIYGMMTLSSSEQESVL